MNLQSISDITSRLQWLAFYNCFPFPNQGWSLPRYCNRRIVTILAQHCHAVTISVYHPSPFGSGSIITLHYACVWLQHASPNEVKLQSVYTVPIILYRVNTFWGLTNTGCGKYISHTPNIPCLPHDSRTWPGHHCTSS